MTRFLIRPEGIAGERVTFDAEETRHLTRVLRLGPAMVAMLLVSAAQSPPPSQPPSA